MSAVPLDRDAVYLIDLRSSHRTEADGSSHTIIIEISGLRSLSLAKSNELSDWVHKLICRHADEILAANPPEGI